MAINDLAFDCAVWSDSLSGLGDSAVVTSWQSQKGAATFTPGFGETGPTLSSVAGGINGHRSVIFSSSGKTMLQAAISSNTGPITLWVVAKYGTNSTDETGPCGTPRVWPGGWAISGSGWGNSTWGLYPPLSGSTVQSDSAPLSSWAVYCVTYDGVTANLWLNGSIIKSSPLSSSYGTDFVGYMQLGMAGSNRWSGQIAAWGMASKALTTQEISQADSWAQDTYGITVADYAESAQPTLQLPRVWRRVGDQATPLYSYRRNGSEATPL